MPVEKNKVVSFDYTLHDDQGQVLDTSQGGQPVSYLHGFGGIIPGLENAMTGKSAGDEFKAIIPPEQAYGPHNPKMVQPVPRKNFSGADKIEPGMTFNAQTPQGPRAVRVAAVTPDTVTVDANHPLAGATLHFDIKITALRDATPQEIEHGHVH